MIAMAPPRPSRPAANPQPAESEQPRSTAVSSTAVSSTAVSSTAVSSTAVPAMADPVGQPRHSRFRLTPGLVAVAEAREYIRAAISAWQVPVDTEVAVLLTSELVTNAITHGQPANGSRELAGGEPAGAGLVNSEPVMLSIRCSRGELRVEVHDQSCDMPPPKPRDAPAESETGRGLMLVAALAAKWGFYRTQAGKAVYFTLIPHPLTPCRERSYPGVGTACRSPRRPAVPTRSVAYCHRLRR
jgi:anti-sigma regulatory factor (Ser/Thr protein kinase)